MLRVAPARKAAFPEMLKRFDFVAVETLDAQLKRYIRNAPKNVALTDDDIMRAVRAVCKQPKRA